MAQWSWTTRYALLGGSHVSLPVPCSSCVVIVIAIVIGNYSLGSEGICPGSKGQQGLCTTNSHGTLFQSHGDVATFLAMVIYVTKRLIPLVTRLVPPLPLMFNQKSTLQAQLRGIRPTQRARLRGTSWTQWRWRAHTRERSPRHVQWRDHTCPPSVQPDDGNNATVSSSERGPIGSEPEPQRKNMRLLRVDRASAPDQKDRSQGWVQSPLHNQGRNECLQDPKKMPSMPQNHL